MRKIEKIKIIINCSKGAPSWQDLLQEWWEREEDNDLTFTAGKFNKGAVQGYQPKNTTGQQAFKARPEAKMMEWGSQTNLLEHQDTNQFMNNAQSYQGPWVEIIDPESGWPVKKKKKKIGLRKKKCPWNFDERERESRERENKKL